MRWTIFSIYLSLGFAWFAICWRREPRETQEALFDWASIIVAAWPAWATWSAAILIHRKFTR